MRSLSWCIQAECPNAQSFVMTKICFQALPMPQFTTLQKKVFPIYFKLQVGLLALTAATHPPLSLLSLSKHWWEYVPLAVALGVSGLNLVVYGPRTEKVMIERVHQGQSRVSLSWYYGDLTRKLIYRDERSK